MKIGVFSDIHGNLPALKKIIEKFNTEDCEYIYCLGDIIAIGPYPKESLEFLLALQNIKFVLGNHEEYFINGVENYKSIDEGEKNHQRWVASLLNDNLKEQIRKFPYLIEEKITNFKVAFMHYAINKETNNFKSIEKQIISNNMDLLFNEIDADIIFYGHDHLPHHIKGKKYYINVGSSGCTKDNFTHCSIVDFNEDSFEYRIHKIEYDKNTVVDEFVKKDIPAKEFILKIFFGVNQ